MARRITSLESAAVAEAQRRRRSDVADDKIVRATVLRVKSGRTGLVKTGGLFISPLLN